MRYRPLYREARSPERDEADRRATYHEFESRCMAVASAILVGALLGLLVVSATVAVIHAVVP